MKTDAGGNAQWTQSYEDTGLEEARCVVRTGDEGYAIAGRTPSFGAGGDDVWLIKTDAEGHAQPQGLFKYGLAWTTSTLDSITLYRGADDVYWNYVRIRIWSIQE